jgi:hypothetical protein
MTTVSEIFTGLGYTEYQLPLIGQLLHLTGGFDGIVKSYESLESFDVSEVLDQKMTLDQLNDLMQQNYFQKLRGEKERQQIVDSPEFQSIAQAIVGILGSLGFTEAVKPTKQSYYFAFVFGATEVGMKSRMDSYMTFMQDEGVSIDQIFILAGARDLWLDSSSDPSTALIVARKINELPTCTVRVATQQVADEGKRIFDETKGNTNTKRVAVVKYFEEKYKIKWPTEADAARCIAEGNGKIAVVDAPKKENGTRPDTFDTVVAWINTYGNKMSGAKKSALAISDQPYIKGQSVPMKLLPNHIEWEVVGKGIASDRLKPEQLLPEFAGVIYKELQLAKFMSAQQEQQRSAVRAGAAGIGI